MTRDEAYWAGLGPDDFRVQCPECGYTEVTERQVTEWIPYLTITKAYEATFPVMTCKCGFCWRDYRAEDAIEAALDKWLSAEPPFTRADEIGLLAEADYYEGKLRGDA